MTPLEREASTPKGELKSPYADFASVAEEGHRKYIAAGRNGCHGGRGGGGMAASDDDDTLFRLSKRVSQHAAAPNQSCLDLRACPRTA
jgi:hypothetical protein